MYHLMFKERVVGKTPPAGTGVALGNPSREMSRSGSNRMDFLLVAPITGPGMMGPVHGQQAAGLDMGVNLRGRDVGMAE
jgi:hypothetical protein